MAKPSWLPVVRVAVVGGVADGAEGCVPGFAGTLGLFLKSTNWLMRISPNVTTKIKLIRL